MDFAIKLTFFLLALPDGIVWQKFGFQFKKGSSKKILWAKNLWVGRRKEPILGYVLKNDVQKNSGGKGLIA